MQSVVKQFEHEAKRFNLEKNSLKTVFIGGGTPSTVSPELYIPFFKKISKYFDKDIEITTEANPNSASLSWIKEMKEFGINRVSFGVQSFDDDKLQYLGRNHTAKSAIKAIEYAYLAGIKNISIDLIHDTKIESKKLLENDIKTAKKLPINHISSYALTIEKGTKFYDTNVKAKENTPDMIWFYEEIEKDGFPRYEVSNFGKYICRHNVGYWEHKDYIGIGAGAVGFKKNERFYPYRNIGKYIQNPIFFDSEKLSKEELKEEKIFLGLRSIVGFDKKILSKKESLKVDILIKEKKVTEKNGKIYNLDYLLSDEIALFILD